MRLERVHIALRLLSKRTLPSYTVSEIELQDEDSGATRNVWHYQYTNWPDFGVPDSPDNFLDFLAEIRRIGVLNDAERPVAIHCSAGIGRSGTFVMVDTSLIMVSPTH